MGFGKPKIRLECSLNPKEVSYKFYDIWFDFGSEKKKIVKNGQNGRNFWKKMKFKIRLLAANGIRPAKIWREVPLIPLPVESKCKIL